MTEHTNGNAVSYTVKELIARVEGKIDGIMLAIHTKADKSDVDVLKGRLDGLERTGTTQSQVNAAKIEKNDQRLDELERGAARSGGIAAAAWKVIPIVVSLLAVAVTLYLRT